MSAYEIWISGQPPKTTSQQKGVFVRGGKPRFFTKKKVQDAKDHFTGKLRPLIPKAWTPIAHPVSVEIRFHFAYTAADKKRKCVEYVPHDKRPDLDNLIKLLLDAMTASGWFKDDSVVTRLVATKIRTDNAGIGISIMKHHV